MMGITVPETSWAYHKYNKTISSIYLIIILQLYISLIWNQRNLQTIDPEP